MANFPPRTGGPSIAKPSSSAARSSPSIAKSAPGSTASLTKIGGITAVSAENAMRVVRPTLGDQAGLVLYRLLRLVALEDIIGRGASGTAYVAGKKLGISLGLPDLESFLELCKDLKIGVIDVPVLSASEIYVDIYECVTCAGMETVGRTLCHFEAGLIAGVVQGVVGKRVRGQEITCMGGLGDKSCGVRINILE